MNRKSHALPHAAFILSSIAAIACLGCSNDADKANAIHCEPGYQICNNTCCANECCNGMCVDTASDSENCGACQRPCTDTQICLNAACVEIQDTCLSSETVCNGRCVDTQNNDDFCGNCDTRCTNVQKCINGKCQIQCPSGRAFDPDTGNCYDLSKDKDHCGSIGNACLSNTYCRDGACSCPAGFIDCDESNDNGCETPGNQCKPACAENETACGAGCCAQTCCNDKCIDTTSSPTACGGCNHICAPTQKCTDSKCVETSALNCNGELKDICWGECVNLKTDRKHCGTCQNTCAFDESCVDGRCRASAACNPGEITCLGTCINPQTDRQNCGACLHACEAGELCIDGACLPDCGVQTLCNNACVDIQNDAKFCGSCTTSCAPGESCISGECQCADGFYDCDANAANGCESTTPCPCKPGETRACWRGDPKKRGVGICRDGSQICDASGRFWSACTGGVYPTPLSCDIMGNLNGLDNDCDGNTDTICRSECDLAAGDLSYIGCEYWSAYLFNLIAINQTVVFSNPSATQTARVFIFDKAGFNASPQSPLYTLEIPPNGVIYKTINTGATNMSNGSGIISNAYRIRSTLPITAYQFNPYGKADAHSNDASLLLPATALGKSYIGMTWHSDTGDDHRSYIAVIATQPGKTDVTIKTTSDILKGAGVEAMNAGDEKTFTLEQFQTLTLLAPAKPSADQTGTTIRASQNIAVFGGSQSSYVPSKAEASCCRDHLEEQLFPLQSWGKSYYAVHAYSKGVAGDFWQILAQEDNTVVSIPKGTAPDLSETFTLNKGEFKRFESKKSFSIHATKPISVGQFLPSQQYNKLSIGDPSFILTVPYEQYRSDYAFMVPPTYDENYITIVAPKNAKIYFDGKDVDTSGFENVVGADFIFGYMPVTAGVHHMTGTEPFGLYNYGYYNMASYGYPIGLDLKIINTN